MNFRAEHIFQNISLADYETLYFDDAFNEALCEALELGRNVEKFEKKDGKLVRVTRVAPRRELPGPAQKLLGGNKIEYTEHIDYTLGKNQGAWRTESSIMSDKIQSAGRFGWEQKGNGVMRWVDGEVKVKVFGLGSVIERFIVSDVEASYDKAAEFTRTWLLKKG